MTPVPPLDERVDAVAIGGSAGAIDALSVLLPALPAGMQASVFVVLHLPRGRPSLLTEVFRPRCAVVMREAEDKEPVDSGTVYFAPPDYHLLIDRGPRLALSVDSPVNFSRPSIDVLFESAADVYAHRLLGIILSGASEDGAAGLAAIHRAGGCTMVQIPETAHARLMVDSALKRTPVEFVLPLDGIADQLRTLRRTGAR